MNLYGAKTDHSGAYDIILIPPPNHISDIRNTPFQLTSIEEDTMLYLITDSICVIRLNEPQLSQVKWTIFVSG